MKKVFTAAILAVTTCAFIGCTKNEVRSISDNPQAVRFLPLNGKHSTKAMIDGTTYPTGTPFGTLAYYLPSGKWNANMKDATLYIPISKVVNKSQPTGGNAWEVEGKTYYWPKSGSLTFFAYSPYSYAEGGDLAVERLDGNDGIQIVNYDVDAHQATDFMVADIAKDRIAYESNGGYTGVPIVFRHKLSQIVGINFQTVATNSESKLVEQHDYANGHSETAGNLEAGDVVFKLKKVEVRNLYTKGDYGYTGTNANHVAEHWMNQANKKDYTWFDKENDPVAFAGNTTFDLKYNTQKTSNNDYLLVLPQPLITPGTTTTKKTDPLIHIEYQVLTYSDATNHSTEDVSEDVYLYDIHNSATAIDMNKKITYNFKINLEDRKIYWAPSVENWDDVSYDDVIK